jgi:hypothetical protein
VYFPGFTGAPLQVEPRALGLRQTGDDEVAGVVDQFADEDPGSANVGWRGSVHQ